MKFFTFLFVLFSINYIYAQEWEQLNNTPFESNHSYSIGFGDKAYVIEGESVEDAPNTFWEYTPETDTWLSIGTFPGTSRESAVGTILGTKLYYGFGDNSKTGRLNDLWVFDASDQSFTQLPSCPCVGRIHPALVAQGNRLFVGAGQGPNGNLTDWWQFNVVTEEWTQKSDIPGDWRHHPFQFEIDDHVYVGGGHATNWSKYNPITEEWTSINDQPGGRTAGTQFTYKGKGYIVAGNSAMHGSIPNNETFMRYSPQANQWESLPPLPNSTRWAPSSFIVNDILYFFDGVEFSTGNNTEMWKFELAALDAPTSSYYLDNNIEIVVYPNPTKDLIKISQNLDTSLNYSMTIINTVGEEMLYQKDINLDKEFDISALSDGLYYLVLKNDSSFHTIKIVKLK